MPLHRGAKQSKTEEGQDNLTEGKAWLGKPGHQGGKRQSDLGLPGKGLDVGST